MPRDASGNYTLAAGNPVVSGTIIESVWANATMNDIAAALTDSLSRTGDGGMLVPFYVADGTAGSPSYSFTNGPTSGLYWDNAANEVIISVNAGSGTYRFTTTGAIFSGDFNLTGQLNVNDLQVTNGILNGAGSAANPSYSFIVEPTSGAYYDAVSDEYRISILGSDIIQVSSTGIDINGRIDTGTWRADVIESAFLAQATADAKGAVELATIGETSAGTDDTRAVTPDGLAGSIFGTKAVQVVATGYETELSVGDGKAYFHVPASLNGMNFVTVHAQNITAGTTGTTSVQIHNVTQAVDVLSTPLTIDSGETGSDTAAVPAAINPANAAVATNDLIRIDLDAITTIPAKGLIVTMEFRLP